MTPAEVDDLSDVMFDAMVRRMNREAAAVTAARASLPRR